MRGEHHIGSSSGATCVDYLCTSSSDMLLHVTPIHPLPALPVLQHYSGSRSLTWAGAATTCYG
jgi:hypothetical protein